MRRTLPPLLVAVLAWLAAAPSWPGEFVYDDVYYVEGNPAVVGEASPWTTPLGDPSQALWRPLTVLTWRAQWALGGEAPAATSFRIANVLLHVAASLAVLALGRALGLSAGGRLVGAALFAVHPVHAEAVAWISGRAELLAALLVLAAWTAHLRPGRGAAIAAPALVAAAALCKENALIAPVLFGAGDALLGRRPWPARRLLAQVGAVAVVVAARVAVLPDALPGDPPYGDLVLPERVVVAANILARATTLLVAPLRMRVFYHRDEFLLADGAALAVLVAAAVATALAWRARRTAGALLLLVPVSLGTVLNLVPIGETFAERFLYLPSALVCLAAGALTGALAERERRRGRGLGASVAIPLVLLALAVPAARAAHAVFRDELSLWAHAARVTPELAHARYNHGHALTVAGRELARDVDEPGAAEELRASLALEPRHRYAAFAHLMLGDAARAGDPPQLALAAHHYRKAVERMPQLVAPRLHLATIAAAQPQIVPPEDARAALAPVLAEGAADPADRQRALELISSLSDS